MLGDSIAALRGVKSGLRHMPGGNAGLKFLFYVLFSQAEWMRLNREMLQFGPFDGQVGDGEAAGGGCALEFTLETPSMLLLRLEKSEGEPRR